MKKPNQAIEAVLAGLRDVDAPVGMELRVLDAVQRKATEPATLVRSFPLRSLAYGLVAGVFAFALMLPAVRWIGHSHLRAARSAAPVHSVPHAATEFAVKNMPMSPMSDGSVHEVRMKAVRRKSVAHKGDSAALRAMREGNHPAPPMPLTDQERMLLRVIHRSDPVELAMLDPEVRSRQAAEGKEEFQRFFEPAVTGEQQ